MSNPTFDDSLVNPQNLAATPIYDLGSPEVKRLAAEVRAVQSDDRRRVQAAHAHFSDANMRTVYSVKEEQPASVTIRENSGSCTQRMAALETVARSLGIATRVRALWLAKRFWYHRLPLLRPVLPDSMLYTWPQFYLDGVWVDFDELYLPIAELAAKAKHVFTNAGESIFGAVHDQPVDFLGKSRRLGRPELDLSGIVTSDAGLYDTRDALLAAQGGKFNSLSKLLFKLLYAGHPILRRAE